MKFARFLISIFFALIPFHALLVTLTGKYLFGGNQDYLPWLSFGISSWKEILFFILFIIGLKHVRKFQWQKIDWLLLAFVGIHLIIAVWQTLSTETSLLQTIWGLRTNLEMVVIFWIIRLFQFSQRDIRRFIRIIIIATSLSLIMGIVQLLVPCEQLTFLGYTPYVSSWVAHKPLPCGHGIGESLATIRIMGTFSGPNQLASFLLITIPLITYAWKHKILCIKKVKETMLGRIVQQVSYATLLLIHVGFLLLTYSRGALLGIICAAGYFIYKQFHSWFKKHILLILGVVLIGIASIIGMAQSRPESTQEHIEKPLAGIERVIEAPFGIGIGRAGPVSLRFPPDGSAGKISENWYIQIAEETGMIGFIILITLLWQIWKILHYRPKSNNKITLAELNTPISITFLAISVNALFLHTWADMSTSLVFWTLFGIIFSNIKRNISMKE